MTEFAGKIPTGSDILKILVELLAKQENVTIEYEIIKKGADKDEKELQQSM